MSVGDVFGFYAYQSDDGHQYMVKLSSAVATAGGFSGTTFGTLPIWPYHYRDLRHVNGFNTAAVEKKGRLPIGSSANSLFQSGGTWNLHGSTFQASGAEGERRPGNHIK